MQNRPNDATEIFLFGIGNAFYGVANLLINRGETVSSSHLVCPATNDSDTLYQRVNGVVSFVAENPVRAVASHTQTWLSRWYRDVSHVPMRAPRPCSEGWALIQNCRIPSYSSPTRTASGTTPASASPPSATGN